MKIFFRYLFVRLLVPFTVMLLSCTMIWIMIDLYGNIDDFISHKVGLGVILRFYSLQIPTMLVTVLPAALLFSTLWTLLGLNRRSELVAFQAGGMSPVWIFSPFLIFALIWVAILAYDLNGPFAESTVTRDRLLLQVKGKKANRNVFENLVYIDNVNRRDWFFQSLDVNQGTATGVEITQRDVNGHDQEQFFARNGQWINSAWRLTGVLQIVYGSDGSVLNQKNWEEKDLDITTPPKQLSLIISQPDQLTASQLTQYINASTSTKEHLAQYRTEWWYRLLSPLSLIVLVLFGLLHGLRTDRRSAVISIAWTILALISYIIVANIFLSAGKYNHLDPVLAVISPVLLFGALAVYLLGLKNGWWWQLWQNLRGR